MNDTAVSTTTITEALAEIKTIGKRIEKKKAAIMQYAARDTRLKDPLESEGGSAEYIRRERQGIKDLEQRIVNIRTAIQKSNLTTTISIEGMSMTLSEWLTFRREVAKGRQEFLRVLSGSIQATRDKVQREGGRVMMAGGANAAAVVTTDSAKPAFEIFVNVEEKALLEEQETLEKILGDLDGKLSLLNATTTIDVSGNRKQ